MLEDIVIRLEDNFSEYLSDIRENEEKRIENELVRVENERLRNEYFAKLLEDKKSYYKRFRRVYKTILEDEDRFGLPSEYTELCMLDVYVNGFYLNPSEYEVVDRDVVLTRVLDVIGSVVELVVTKAVGIAEGDYDDLRGLSAYEVAVRNGFEGSEAEWLKSLGGSGGYKRMVKSYVTVNEAESRFELPYVYHEDCSVDVYVNGIRLCRSEYVVEGNCVVLVKPLDVIGTMVELDVIDPNVVNVTTIDDFLSDESKNPVQNKVIKMALDDKASVSDVERLSADLGNIEDLLKEV